LDDTTRRIPLRDLAAGKTDATHVVTAPVIGDDALELDPPIACPRCGGIVRSATWGAPQPVVRELKSSAQMVDETRDLEHDAEIEFVSSQGYSAVCRPGMENGVPVNYWLLHLKRARKKLDLEAIAVDLRERLTTAGSRCTEIESLPRQVSFREWLPSGMGGS
jgi:hypothetical protein